MAGKMFTPAAMLAGVKGVIGFFLKGAPPRPCREVEELMHSLQMTPKHVHQLYKVFHKLKQLESTSIITAALEISEDSILNLVSIRKRWVARVLRNLVELGGCAQNVQWDNFLFILLSFCSLSKIELCQVMFFIIVKEVKSWTVHYLTASQLQEFYDFYHDCPVKSFNTSEISFAKLPLNRYYLSDFTEMAHRFGQLVNPAIHLQRSLQMCLPSLSFWENYDRVEVFNRKITLEFFMIRKSHVFLRGQPPFRETCDMMLPDALGGEPVNQDQWRVRAAGMPQTSVWGALDARSASYHPMKDKPGHAAGGMPPLALPPFPGQMPGQMMGHPGQMMGHPGQMMGHPGQMMGHPGQMMGHPGQMMAPLDQQQAMMMQQQQQAMMMALPPAPHGQTTMGGGLTLAGVGEAMKRTIASSGRAYDPEDDDDLDLLPPPDWRTQSGGKGLPTGAPLGAKVSYPGQPSAADPTEGAGALSALPKWMRDYVSVPTKPKATVRFMETDFIRKSRERHPKRENIVTMLQRSSPQELLDRPKKHVDARDLR